MKFTNVKGIIWDLDGTLLDSFSVFESVMAEVVAESGHKMPSTDFIAKNYHGSLEETIKIILGVKNVEEINKLAANFAAKQQKYYVGDLDSHLFLDALRLAQHAATLNIHQMIVTNRKHKGVGKASPKFIVASTSLADYIHEVRPADEVKFIKPDKSSIGDWNIKHGLKPKNILVIGDQHVDAQLAINLGTRAVLVRRNKIITSLDSEELLNSSLVTIVDSLDEVELD